MTIGNWKTKSISIKFQPCIHRQNKLYDTDRQGGRRVYIHARAHSHTHTRICTNPTQRPNLNEQPRSRDPSNSFSSCTTVASQLQELNACLSVMVTFHQPHLFAHIYSVNLMAFTSHLSCHGAAAHLLRPKAGNRSGIRVLKISFALGLQHIKIYSESTLRARSRNCTL